jgi:hypothetical protein
VKPGDEGSLKPSTAVWVWLTRLGKSRWWPGAVMSVDVREALPSIRVEIAFGLITPKRSYRPVGAGITSTRMRFIELRDIDLNGEDKPGFVPVSLLRQPEQPAAAARRLETPGASPSLV